MSCEGRSKNEEASSRSCKAATDRSAGENSHITGPQGWAGINFLLLSWGLERGSAGGMGCWALQAYEYCDSSRKAKSVWIFSCARCDLRLNGLRCVMCAEAVECRVRNLSKRPNRRWSRLHCIVLLLKAFENEPCERYAPGFGIFRGSLNAKSSQQHRSK